MPHGLVGVLDLEGPALAVGALANVVVSGKGTNEEDGDAADSAASNGTNIGRVV